MVKWGVMFCKYSASMFIPLYQYNLRCSSTSLFLNYCHFISYVFERFCFIPEFTNTYVVELSVLRGVADCSWSNAIKAGHMPIAISPLLKVTNISDSAAEDTTLRIVLHYVYEAISLGVRFYCTWSGPVAQIKITCIIGSFLWHGDICYV